MYSIFNSNINKINITIYDTPFEKKLNNSTTFTPKHINSGYSIPYSKQIIIYRNEELFKVLVHELLHIFQFNIQEDNDNCGIFCDLYSIKSESLLVNEAIVELYALIYNCILLSLKIYKKININKIIDMLNIELDFNLYQTSKILYFNNFNNIESFLSKSTNKFISQVNTNIISYIIIKTLILFNINKLHNYNILDNRKLIEKIIIKFFKDIKYQTIINSNINNIIKYGYIDDNLRMSLLS